MARSERAMEGLTSVDAKPFRRHPRAGNPVRNLLERNVPRVIGTPVVGLRVDAERREAAVVSRAEALLDDVVRRRDQLVANLLRGFKAI